MSQEESYTSGAQFADEIIAALTQSGIDLADSQSFSFHLRVASELAAAQCAAEAELIGLETAVAESDDDDFRGWVCVASMEMTPSRERLVEIGERFIELARQCDGDFAGWEVNTDDLSNAVEEMFGSFFEQLGGLVEDEEREDGEFINVHALDFDAQLSPEADRFLKEACDEFNVKQAHLTSEWRFEECDRWAFDQETGVFRLDFEDGSRFEADGQILGSHAPDDASWEWAWNNPNVSEDMARDSRIVRELGATLGIDYLGEGKIPMPDETSLSHICGLGVKATNSFGAYNGAAGDITVMILLKNPRWIGAASDGN